MYGWKDGGTDGGLEVLPCVLQDRPFGAAAQKEEEDRNKV